MRLFPKTLVASLFLSACSATIESPLSSIISDTEAPILTLKNNTSTLINSSNQYAFRLSGNCEGAEDGQRVKLYSNGALLSSAAPARCNNEKWSGLFDLSSFPSGTITIFARMSDAAGNKSISGSRNFTKLATGPTIVISSPSANSSISLSSDSPTFVVSGTCTANDSSSGTVVIQVDSIVNGTGAVCNGISFSATIDTTGLSEGDHLITATITDSVWNTSATSGGITVTKDTVSPGLSINASATLIGVANEAAYPIAGTCTGAEDGQPLVLKVGGVLQSTSAAILCNANAWSGNVNLSAHADGSVTVTADLSDAAGNTATQASQSFTKNTSVPVISIDASGTFINSANASAYPVSGSCVGAEDAQTISLKIGSTVQSTTIPILCTSGAWSGNVNLSAQADGSVTLRADVSNLAGNAATQASRVFTKDVAAPSITITVSSTMINVANAAAYPIAGTCTGAENGRPIVLKVGGTTLSTSIAITCSSNSWSGNVDLSSQGDGTVTITGDVSDAAGNAATQASRSFNKDATAPSIVISPAPVISISNSAAFPVSGTCVGADNGQAITLKVGSTTQSTSGAILCSSGAWTGIVDLSAQPAGSVTLIAEISADAAGNSGAQTSRLIPDQATVAYDAYTNVALLYPGLNTSTNPVGTAGNRYLGGVINLANFTSGDALYSINLRLVNQSGAALTSAPMRLNVWLWNSAPQTVGGLAFSNQIGTPGTPTAVFSLGNISLATNSSIVFNVALNSPIALNPTSGSKIGITFNYEVFEGGVWVSKTDINSGLVGGGAQTAPVVGSNATGTAPNYGFYRSVNTGTDTTGNFSTSSFRQIGVNSGLPIKLNTVPGT